MPKRQIAVSASMLRPERSAPATERNADISAYFTQQNVVSNYVSLDLLRPNPFQPRKDFRDLELDELAQSMRQQGFFGTLLARPAPDGSDHYEIAYGERRLRAARLAGLAQVPIYIRDLDDIQMLEIAMAENILRADLNPLEEAQGLAEMKRALSLSIRELAARLGKGKSYIEKRLYLLDTPPDVRQMIVTHPETVRAARPLAGVADPQIRAHLIQEVIAGRLSSDDVSLRADRLLGRVPDPDQDEARAEVSPVGDIVADDQRPIAARAKKMSPVGNTQDLLEDSTIPTLRRDRLSIGYRALTAFFGTRRVTYDEDTASKVRAIRDLCDRYLGMWEARGEH